MLKDDNSFFRCLYWIVLLLIMMLALAIFSDVKGGDMDLYLKAQRINNG